MSAPVNPTELKPDSFIMVFCKVSTMKNPAMMVNVTWNKEKWRGININDKAGHEFVRNAAGHESLNFDFNKKGIDDETWVYGYFQLIKSL